MAREVALSNGGVVIVDDEDYDMVSRWRWRRNGDYASRSAWDKQKKRTGPILMHRFLLNAPPNRFVDHINRDTLDNRRENLRLIPRGANPQNKEVRSETSTGVRGVQRTKGGRYVAQVGFHQDGKRRNLYLGTFATIEEADAAAKEGRRRHLPYSAEALSSVPARIERSPSPPPMPAPKYRSPDSYPCGHPRSEENSRRDRRGYKYCCACNNLRASRHRRAKRAAKQEEKSAGR